MLGEKIEATITAKYYFGSPVTKAKVKYKINRTTHSEQWYPCGTVGLVLRPGLLVVRLRLHVVSGLARLGLLRGRCRSGGRGPISRPSWWPISEVSVGPDGTVKVQIDTGVAKAIHRDQDHSYSITAEVIDESRRTIVGSGTVLVARKPFTVYAWVDRGYYRIGDTIALALQRPHARRQARARQGRDHR